jgi:hypothetical protein
MQTDREKVVLTPGHFEKEALLEALSCGADKSKKGSFDAPIQVAHRHAPHATLRASVSLDSS